VNNNKPPNINNNNNDTTEPYNRMQSIDNTHTYISNSRDNKHT
jgi:hypothetical protein